MIRTDDLQFEGLHLLQNADGACFSEDAVLLIRFLRLSPSDRVIDLGAGNGILSILGSAKTGARFVGIEKDAAQCALAVRSALQNGQSLPFYCMDVREAPAALGHGTFTAAVMNPPYFTAGAHAKTVSRENARHTTLDTLNAFLLSAFLLLDNGGKLFCCYPAAQLTDLFAALRANRLEPKRLRPVLCNPSGVPKRVLIEAKKLGRPGLIWESAEATT